MPDNNTPRADLDLLLTAARAAGDIALGFHGPSAKSWDKPDGAGPVTEADLAVNDLLCDQLRAARPDYGWLSEETDDTTDRLSRDRVFIIDPIDGTRSFANGNKTWAHALAVVERGQVTSAVIYLPARDMMFAAAQGAGATLNGNPISPSEIRTLEDATMLAAKPMLQPQFWLGGAPPPFDVTHRASLAYRMGTVAQGRFDGMFTFRPSWEWDIAAGDLILREAGAVTSDQTGAPLRFNNPTPQVKGVVTANPSLHAQIMAALA